MHIHTSTPIKYQLIRRRSILLLGGLSWILLHSFIGGGVDDDVGSDADVSTGTTFPFKKDSSGLLVILADVLQQGLYPPVEAVPLKPSSLLLSKVYHVHRTVHGIFSSCLQDYPVD